MHILLMSPYRCIQMMITCFFWKFQRVVIRRENHKMQPISVEHTRFRRYPRAMNEDSKFTALRAVGGVHS